jgi:arylsulfatase
MHEQRWSARAEAVDDDPIGVDTRTSVNDKDYQVPFRFNGKINKLTFNLKPAQLAEEDERKMQEAIARARD